MKSSRPDLVLGALNILEDDLLEDLLPIIYDYYTFKGIISRQFNLGDRVIAVTVMPSGELVIATRTQLILLDSVSGDYVVLKPIRGHVTSILAVSSDTIAYSLGGITKLFVFNLITGEQFFIRVKTSGLVHHLTIFPTTDGSNRFLISFNGDARKDTQHFGKIVLWDLITQKAFIVKWDQPYVVGITILHNEVIFATHTGLQVWNMELNQVRDIPIGCKITAMTSLPDNLVVGCYRNNNIVVINPWSRKIMATFLVTDIVRSLSVLPNEKLVAWVGSVLEVRDVNTGEVEHTLKAGNRVKMVTLPNANIVYISEDGEITVYV